MTHFWPDYTALIAELRMEARLTEEWHPDDSCIGTMRRAADALEDVARSGSAALAGAREEERKRCIEIVQAHEGHIKTKDCVACILDQLSAHPTAEPAKAWTTGKEPFPDRMTDDGRGEHVCLFPTTEPAKAEEP